MWQHTGLEFDEVVFMIRSPAHSLDHFSQYLYHLLFRTSAIIEPCKVGWLLLLYESTLGW